ncbi:transcription elongation regulator [Salix suchowensis]|nr:transcription elongation regulator [Salix suchowensis]
MHFEWGNPNWEQQQAWEYPSAWAAAKNSALDDQHPQSQLQQVADQKNKQQPFPATTYQQFPVSAAPHAAASSLSTGECIFQHGQPSYVSDRPQPYPGGAATFNASPSVHQQEVPSSYSSVTDWRSKGAAYRSMPLPISSAQEGQHHLPPSLSAIGRSVLTEQPFAYSNQVANPTADLSNQPLEFAPGFNYSVGTVKGIGSAAPMPSISSWTPAVTTGVVYPPALPPGAQDPTIVPSSVSGMLHRHLKLSWNKFQPPISPGGVPYVLASVPNWLKEEIIKKCFFHDELLTQEIKRILTEHQPVTSNQKYHHRQAKLFSTPKASAKVLVPVKTKESENEDVNEKSSSSSPGNVLGLANYASDEDDEIESSSISNSRENRVAQLLAIPESAEDMTDAAENGNSQVELGKNSGVTNLEGDLSKTCTVGSDNKINGAFSELSEHAHSKVVSGVRHVEISVNGEKLLESNDKAVPKATIRENFIMKSERIGESVNVEKSVMDYSQARDTRVRPDQDSRHEKGDDGHKKHDTKHSSKEKTDDLNGSKGKRRERKDKTGESAKESESRRRSSHPEVKEDGKDAEKLNRSSVKEDATRKRDHAKEKEEDRARHKPTSDSNKHKRTRSSSISGRGRNSKDNDSSDEASDDSKRKHSRKRRSSPSPVRSSRRYSYIDSHANCPTNFEASMIHEPYTGLLKIEII